MRPGWNPVRRNRNIGTKAQGHGANNRMVIPESWHELKRYWENLSSYVLVRRLIGTKEQLFFVEPTKDGWFYPGTIDDLTVVLGACDRNALESFDFIVMRQPTRKERLLCPVWGRAAFVFDIGNHHGSAIVIEAQSLGSYCWEKSLTPERSRELERIRSDGHPITIARRDIEISPTATSLRATILYRTLLHEIGHRLDYRRSTGEEWDGKTRAQKEDFAHRYAHETRVALTANGRIPFDIIADDVSFESDGVKREWFVID